MVGVGLVADAFWCARNYWYGGNETGADISIDNGKRLWYVCMVANELERKNSVFLEQENFEASFDSKRWVVK